MQQFYPLKFYTGKFLSHARFLFLPIILTVLLSVKTAAQNYTVNSNADIAAFAAGAPDAGSAGSGVITLRSAVQAATTTAGTHIITIPASITTINLTLGQITVGNAAVGNNITINGPGKTVLTINQTTLNKVFVTGTGAVTFTLTGLKINYTGPAGAPANIYSGGGAAVLAGGIGANTTLTNIAVTNFKVQQANGGAVSISTSNVHTITITDCDFSNNYCGGGGGAVSINTNGTSTVSGCTFTNNQTGPIGDYVAMAGPYNTGGNGGALSITGSGAGGNNLVEKCTFVNNSVLNATGPAYGGAIAHNNGTTIVRYNRFIGNTAAVGTSNTLHQAGGVAANVMTANDNWWGVNTGPAASDKGLDAGGTTPVTATHLQLKATASPATVCPAGTSTVTAGFLSNSAGTVILASNLTALIGLPITFTNAVLGTLSGAQATIQASGTAMVTYTAGASTGAGSVNAVVDNVPNNDATAKASITIAGMVVANPVTSTGTAGTAFSQTFTASGPGSIPYTYTIATGTLPTGLTLSAAGVLSGTPTQTGSFPITVTVTPASGCPGTGPTYNLQINCQSITVTNPGVTTGTNGTFFTRNFTQSGANGSPAYSINTGTLPNGVTLSSSGVLSGTPSAPAGNYPITVKVTDGNGCTGISPTYTLVISCQTMSVSNPGTATGQINVPFSQTFTQTGGIGAITFTTTSTLPAGITLSSAGLLAGTPTASGTFNIIVKATDANGCFANGPTYTLVISACPTITVTNPATTTGTATVPFSETFTSTGGTLPVTYSTASTLPTGLTLSSAGVLSGTPTQAGTFPIVVVATDGNSCTGTGSTYTLIIGCPAAITGTATPSSQTICSGGSITTIVLAGAPAGATYNWTRDNTGTVTGIAASGSGNISGSLTNTTAAPITVTFTITPVYYGTCSGTPYTATVLVNPTPVAVATPASQTICSAGTITTIALTSATSGTTFNWTRNNTAGVTGIAASGSGDISGALTNTTNAPITVTFSITPTANTCPGTLITATVIVNPTPNAVATPASQTVCSANAITTIVLTGNVSGTVFNWTRDNTAGVTGISAGGAGNISGTLTNTTNAPITVTFTITPTANSCPGTAITATVLVNPTPNAVATPASQTICSAGTITPIALTGNVSGTTFNWTRNNTGTVTGIAASGSGDISGALTNTTNAPITVTFSITPTANTCPGTLITATVIVNPTPNAVATPASQTVCSANAITTIVLTGNVSGTIFNWTRDNTIGVTGIGGSGAGNISGTLTNTTNAPITVTFSITPTANSCPGTAITATVLVNPTPNAVATPASQTTCSGAAITTIALTGNVSGTVFNWTRNNTGTVTGIAASGSGDISGALTNTTASPITVTFTITPTANGCPGTPITATVLLNPTPDATATPASQTICSASPITPIVITGTIGGTVFNWTRDNTGTVTGITASGTGDISGTLTNTTNAPVTVTFTIIPTAFGCTPGAPVTATVLVNPTPNAVATPASQTICSANPIATIVLSGNVSGTTYSWTRDNTGSVTGIGASGAGNISGTLTNTTNAPITVTFSITPTANGCPGTPITATVLVNPTPNAVATPASQTICSPASITTIVLTGNVSGTTYNWTRDNTGTVTGIAASGSGDISGTLTNTTSAPVTVTFTITPTANGCPGAPITATVLVNPLANAVATPASQTICSAGTITTIVLTGNVSGTVFNWTRDNTGTVTGIAASGTGNISGTLTNTTSAPITVTFTITPTANGCPGTPTTATVLVNPTPNAVATPASQTVCSANAITTIVLSGNVSGTTYAWTRDNTVAVTGIAASGSGNISGTLTNTTNAPVTVTFTIIPTANGCPGAPITATILVNPRPNAVATPASQTLCTGSPITTIVLTGNVSGTVFNWTRNNTVNVTGIAASGSGNISGTLTNTTITQQTVTFTITPTANGCPGTPITATVIVNPTPTVTCPANITVNNNPGICGAVVNYPVATATGTPTPVITYSIPSGSTFPVGTTHITVTATNICNVVTCGFDITVVDNEVPTITCPSVAPRNTDPGVCTATIATPNPVTGDNCGVTQLTWAMTGATTGTSPATGINNLGTKAFNLGITTVTYTVKDAAGNTTTCSFTVNIADGQLPVITPLTNRTVCAGVNATFTATATNALGYQWQVYNGTTWNNIPGATASSYTVANPATALNLTSYRVVVTGLCTIVTSTSATLFVNALPTITLTANPYATLLPNQTTTLTATTNPSGGSFVWFFNGTAVPGITGSTFGPIGINDLGLYSTTYTDPNGCVATSSTITITGTVSDILWVYPNPNYGQFQVRFFNDLNGKATINVYDALGQKVYAKEFTTGSTPYSQLDVDLGAIKANAVYTVELVDGNGKRRGTKRIVVQSR